MFDLRFRVSIAPLRLFQITGEDRLSLLPEFSCVWSMRAKYNVYLPFFYISIVAATILSEVTDLRCQPTSPVISRVTSTTNGLALSWSGESSNTAYTVQFHWHPIEL
jgi:hypothetical protein